MGCGPSVAVNGHSSSCAAPRQAFSEGYVIAAAGGDASHRYDAPANATFSSSSCANGTNEAAAGPHVAMGVGAAATSEGAEWAVPAAAAAADDRCAPVGANLLTSSHDCGASGGGEVAISSLEARLAVITEAVALAAARRAALREATESLGRARQRTAAAVAERTAMLSEIATVAALERSLADYSKRYTSEVAGLHAARAGLQEEWGSVGSLLRDSQQVLADALSGRS